MKGYAYYNGNFGTCDDIKIPLTDRTIYFGDGVYDMMIGHDGSIFLFDEHSDRLFSNLKSLNINFSLKKSELYDLILQIIKLSGYKSYSIYIAVSRSHDERVHSYKSSKSSDLLIIISNFDLSKRDGLALITEEDKRYRFCNIKTTNLLPAVLSSTKADMCGCDEAVFHRKKTVTECAHSNIFILKNGRLITHPKSEFILPGITRELLIKIAYEYKIPVSEQPFTLNELFSADEVIITSTTKLIKTVDCIDGRKILKKGGHLVSDLQKAAIKRYDNI